MATHKIYPPLIGLYSPYPQMGKSTVASILVAAFGYELLKFSSPIKAPLYALGLNEEEIEGRLKDTPNILLRGTTPRAWMHQTSQDMFARLGPDCLSEIIVQKVSARLAQGQRVVIDDVRFPENYRTIKRVNLAEIWHVATKPVAPQMAYDTGHLEAYAFDLRLGEMPPSQVSTVIANHFNK